MNGQGMFGGLYGLTPEQLSELQRQRLAQQRQQRIEGLVQGFSTPGQQGMARVGAQAGEATRTLLGLNKPSADIEAAKEVQGAIQKVSKEKGFAELSSFEQRRRILREAALVGARQGNLDLANQATSMLSELSKQQKAEAIANLPPEKNVQSAKNFLDGTSIILFEDGSRQVMSPDGQLLAGKAAMDQIRAAGQYETELQGQRAGERTAGAEAQKKVPDILAGVERINSLIPKLDRAIELVRDEGANVGFIASRLPSWNRSSIELDNIRSQLGLDVVGSVTFGALSEGELALALNTALPTNMDGEGLIQWLERKKIAQQKLRDYLTEQAMFLADEPGRTLGDWIKEVRRRGEALKTPSPENVNLKSYAAMPLTEEENAEYERLKQRLGN
jgi:hypothetical protein